MKNILFLLALLTNAPTMAAARFVAATPEATSRYQIDSKALCQTAQATRAYLDKGAGYDAAVIHEGVDFRIPLARVKATLAFVCQHQQEMNDPAFVRRHFDFYRWYPDRDARRSGLAGKLPENDILMTRYYVHRARASSTYSATTPFALYGLAADEASLSLEDAQKRPGLLRFRYGKQAILRGALAREKVPALAWLAREDLEEALLQGTLVADLNHSPTIFNVHRCNDRPWEPGIHPYQQERYWYFKVVDGIKGYGKDADNKITVNSGVTFAADLERFGLGKLLMVQYPDQHQTLTTRVGVLADTGGAFHHNAYQVDFLAGTYTGKAAFYQANRGLPDYVSAYFMVLKP